MIRLGLLFVTACSLASADSVDDITDAEAAVLDARTKSADEYGPAVAAAVNRLREVGRKAVADADAAFDRLAENDPRRNDLGIDRFIARNRFADALFHSVVEPRVRTAELFPPATEHAAGDAALFEATADQYFQALQIHDDFVGGLSPLNKLRLAAALDDGFNIGRCGLRRGWCLLWAARRHAGTDVAQRQRRFQAAVVVFDKNSGDAREVHFDQLGSAAATAGAGRVAPAREALRDLAAKDSPEFRAAVLWELAIGERDAGKPADAIAVLDRLAALDAGADKRVIWQVRHAPVLKLVILRKLQSDITAPEGERTRAAAAAGALEAELKKAGLVGPPGPDGRPTAPPQPAATVPRIWPGVGSITSPAAGEPGFAGLPVGPVGSVVFVVDRSGSMDAIGDFLKIELARAANRRGAQRRMNLVWMRDGEPEVFAPQPLPMNAENRTRLFKHLLDVRFQGSTDPRGAIYVALKMKPDAIVVITDGNFEAEFTDTVARDSGGIPIHLIHVDFVDGEKPTNLKKLAERTKGRYTSFKEWKP